MDEQSQEANTGNKKVAKQPAKDAKSSGSEGVTVSEEYQKMAHKAVHGRTKHEISHLRSRMNDREDEIRQEEMASKESGKGLSGPPSEYSADSSIEST